MKYKVSIIIPVHNGEKYLEEVLKSIKNQTIGFNNIEVIIVSDGSTDKTDKIAKAFVNKKENCHFLEMIYLVVQLDYHVILDLKMQQVNI